MSTVGQRERRTQARVVSLFRDRLGYRYLGDWGERVGNRNVEESLLRPSLARRKYDDALVTRALHVLTQAAGDTSKSLYDRNRAVYELLRYGVKVKTEVGENTQTVWLIDWKHPEENDFAIAEEVTVLAAKGKAHTKRPDVVDLCERHRPGRAGAEAFDHLGGRGHPPEPRQPEEGLHRAVLLDDPVGDGG